MNRAATRDKHSSFDEFELELETLDLKSEPEPALLLSQTTLSSRSNQMLKQIHSIQDVPAWLEILTSRSCTSFVYLVERA